MRIFGLKSRQSIFRKKKYPC